MLKKILEDIPDEFYTWVKEVQQRLSTHYQEIEHAAKDYFKDLGDRKVNALFYQQFQYPAILFKMLDKSDYSDIIWKLVKPKDNKSFKICED